MKRQIVKGATSVILDIFIRDSSSTTGAGLTGLTNASGSLTCYYHRNTSATATAVSLVTMTVGTFTSSGFKEVDATNMPGWYQLCLPDAAFATGATSVGAHLKGAANMAPLPLEIELTAVDNQDAVRFGLTALPNVASGSAGAIPTTGTGSNQINVTGGRADADVLRWNGTAVSTPATAGIPDVNIKNIDNDAASASGTVTFPNATLASTTNITAGTITTTTNLTNAPTNGDLTATMKASVTTAATAATPIAASVSGNVGGNVVGSVGSVAAGGITAASFAANALDAVWSTAARLLTAGTNIVLAKGVGLTGLNDLSTAQVNTEMVDVLTVDTYAEPAGAPAATSSLKDKIGWGFKLARNLRKTTSAVDSVYNDAGAVVDSTAALSDDGVTFTRGEYT